MADQAAIVEYYVKGRIAPGAAALYREYYQAAMEKIDEAFPS